MAITENGMRILIVMSWLETLSSALTVTPVAYKAVGHSLTSPGEKLRTSCNTDAYSDSAANVYVELCHKFRLHYKYNTAI